MDAKEFVKKFGIEHAKYLLEDTTLEYFAIHSQCAGKYFEDTVCVNDLKTLVNAYELVQKFGGLEEAKKCIDDKIYPELGRAIKLVKSVEE